MKLRTMQLEIGDSTYTATEPMCAAFDELTESRGAGNFGASAEFVRSCLARHHPDITAKDVAAGLTPRLLGNAVKALMALADAKEEEPGEAKGA